MAIFAMIPDHDDLDCRHQKTGGIVMAIVAQPQSQQDTVQALEALDTRLRWLSAWTVHNANHVRKKRDGMKVGGHQASCASMTTIMSALYFHALRPQDKVAVKPHAGPVLHAIHYLLGNQSLDQLQRFRGLGGMQSYPSRTKDQIPVDFSTGSVGLGWPLPPLPGTGLPDRAWPASRRKRRPDDRADGRCRA
jgi:pyruvate dehydrogenase complex dehydrogenase (E1) component